jgi:hypothetical protein
MTYDLIIVASSTHRDLIRNTQQTIDTCIADTANINVILVETGTKYEYNNVNQYIEYKGEFNYNHALNLGLKKAKSDIQILANNDIIFHPGWSVIGDLMRSNNYLSASALSADNRQKYFKRGNFIYEGYYIGFQLAGWCIFTDKKLWEKIEKLDESHKFWFSDNMYVDQLKTKGIKHALFCCIQVDHLGSQTLKKLDSRKQIKYTHAEGKNIKKTYPKNIQKKI